MLAQVRYFCVMVSLKSIIFFLQAEEILKKCEALDSPCRVLKFAVEFITVGSDFNKYEAKNCSLLLTLVCAFDLKL